MRKKLIVVGPTPPPHHGVSLFTTNLINSDFKRYFKIILLDTADRRTKPNMGRFDIVNIYLGVKHLLKLFILFLIYRAEILYVPISQNIPGFFRDGLFILIGKAFRASVVIHLHGGIFDRFYNNAPHIFKKFIRFALSNVDRAIVLCDRFVNIFDGLIPAEKVRVVNNGIDCAISEERFKDRVRRKRDGKNKVLFLGTLDKRKGFIDIIRAVPYIIKHNKNVEFVIAGKWHFQEDREEAIRLIKKFDIGDYVKFPGVVSGSEKWDLFLGSDLFVFPTHFIEGQPLVVLEAMMAGLPIVATPMGCLECMLKEGLNGFFTDGSPEDIAEKIVYLLQNKGLREKISEYNRKEFLEKYTWNKCVENLVKVIKEV